MLRIQIITIIVNILFILYIARLIVKGKLREEYAIVWIICTVFLVVFSFWTDGGVQPGIHRVYFRHIGLPAAFKCGGFEVV